MAIAYKKMKTLTRPDGSNAIQYEITDSAGRKMIAPKWYEHEDDAFTAGQHIEKDGVLYRFLVPHTAESAWNSNEVTAVDVGEEIEAIVTALNQKANKVSGAVNGNFAALDAGGNLTDSGKKPSDFITEHQDISGKADKVVNGTSGNFVSLDANGNIQDSGSKASDFLTQHQDISGKADKTDTVLETTLSRGRKANTTVGEASYAFGDDVEASGDYSHAEGSGSISRAEAAHAEGSGGMAAGAYSHVEGLFTGTCSEASHAEGTNTLATRKSQHVFGENNVWEYTEGYQYTPMDDPAIHDKGEFIEIVGNGDLDESEYSNARTLDWDGNERLAGDLYVHADEDGTGGDKVATEAAVQEVSTELKSQIDGKASIIRDTVSNVAIASVPDAAANLPLTALQIVVEPVQYLHGQANPYPAGGGKNKLQLLTTESTTSNSVTFTVNADGTVSTQGTANGTAVFRHYIEASDLPSESLILNGTPSGGAWATAYGMAFCNAQGSVIGTADSGSGTTISAENLSNLKQIQIVVRSGVNASGLVFKPMVRLASVSDSTFAPYSNICPITGWTGANVYVAPTNSPDDPDKQTYPISWQTEAGTVHSGQIDVLTGELTVDGTYMTITGNDLYSFSESDAYSITRILTNTYSSYDSVKICDTYPVVASAVTTTGQIGIRLNTTNGRIYIYDERYTSLSQAQELLNENPIHVVAHLATPLTYQLDPITINTLLGINNVWADCGNILLMEYGCDTKQYVEKRLTASQALMELIVTANRESEMKASKAYSSGNLIIVNGTLYKATTSIANGATLTVGTNVTQTTVAAELAALA